MEDFAIRRATIADLAEIRDWLKREYDESFGDGFWCNIGIIEDAQKDGALTVLASLPDDLPVAFCVSDPSNIHIFEVKPDSRRQGFGRKLAEHIIAEARYSGSMGMIGQCRPETSVPFWEMIGFIKLKDVHA